MSTKTFPVSIVKKIENEMGHNAPIRTISILIPSESISFGRNCIVLHNDIIRKIYDSPDMKLGSQIVGADSTHKILEKNGRAGPLKVFTFINAKGGESTGNASAHDIQRKRWRLC